MSRKVKVPRADYQALLRGYGAHPLGEYSNNRRHVYYSSALQNYLVVRMRAGDVEIEFTPECPCGTET
jgi:hypothetical protein